MQLIDATGGGNKDFDGEWLCKQFNVVFGIGF
jgi:hypothetical protein